MRNKIIFVSLFIVVFILGLVSGIFYYKKYKVPTPTQQKKICWDQAKQRMSDLGFMATLSNQPEIKSIYGTVTVISGNKLTLKIKPLDFLADPDLDNRTIEISDTTKIYRMKASSDSQASSSSDSLLSQEGISGSGSAGQKQENSQSIQDPKESSFSKTGYQNIEISIGDIKSNDMISVLAEDNIRDQKNIKAKFIVVLPETNQAKATK